MSGGTIEAFAIALGVVFLAELGDKTQLLVLGFATRHRALPVALGVTAAAALMMAASVVAGGALGAIVPVDLVLILGGVAFIAFAAWTLLDRDDEDDLVGAPVSPSTRRSTLRTALVVGGAFGLAELGDKSMLATLALAARADPVATWAGATLAETGLGLATIFVGRQIGTRIPRRAVRYVAAAAFAGFGLLLLFEAVA